MAEAEAAAMSAPRHDVEAVGDEYAQRGAAVAFDAELVDSTERRRLEAEATDAFHPDGNGGGEAGDGSLVLTTALSAEEARFAAAPPLAELYLSHCTSLMALPSTIDVLAHLVAIDLRSCTRLESLPAALARLPKLVRLNLAGCFNITFLPEAPEPEPSFPALQELDVTGCLQLRELPGALSSCSALRELIIEGCSQMRTVPDLSPLAPTLQVLNMQACLSLHPVPGWIDILLQHPAGKFCKIVLPGGKQR